MAIPTPDQIDEAVPVDGIPSRALVNAVLKEVLAAMSYLPDDGTIPTRSVENDNFTGGRLKTTTATDPDDCVNLIQMQTSIPTFPTLSGVPAALTSAQAAGTPSIRAIGTSGTTAAAGNHAHGAATASASGFMTAAIFNLISAMPPFRVVSSAPEEMDSTGQKWDIFVDVTNDILYLCVDTNTWRNIQLTGW